MNVAQTQLEGLAVEVAAHEDEQQRLLLFSATADQISDEAERPPARVAVVIDRSGSMQGSKLAITIDAVSRLIRSLSPDDRVGIVIYDHFVEVLSEMRAPSESLAQSVERVHSGGNTNLYGGWLAGAKLVGKGGRVILLSDGLANAGRFTDAYALSRHAGISYEKYGVTTTTIGIGEGYDEAIMAGMAREGGGSHYFANDVDGILNAFSHERFSLGEVALTHVSLKVGKEVRQLGHLWSGEVRSVVLPLMRLDVEATIRYTIAASNRTLTESVRLPEAFGHSDRVTLEQLFEAIAEVEDRSLSVRDQDSARRTREEVRSVLMRLLKHPLSDEDAARAVATRLEAAIARLAELERRYDEREATMHRKRSMQSSHNLRQPAKVFSNFAEDAAFVGTLRESSRRFEGVQAVVADARALSLAPLEQWRTWQVIPTGRTRAGLRVLMVKPTDGFTIAEIEKIVQLKVRANPRSISLEELEEGLAQLAAIGIL